MLQLTDICFLFYRSIFRYYHLPFANVRSRLTVFNIMRCVVWNIENVVNLESIEIIVWPSCSSALFITVKRPYPTVTDH